MIESLPYGIRRDWLDGRGDGAKICVILTPDEMDRPAIDAWAEVVRESFAAIPDDQPAYMLHDLQAHMRLIPRYVRRQAATIYTLLGERQVFGAFVSSDAMLHALLTAIREAKPPDKPQIVERIFTDRDSALAWLRTVSPATSPEGKQG